MFVTAGSRAGRGEGRAWHSKLFDRIFGSTVGYFLQRTSTGWRAAQGTNDPYPSGTSFPASPSSGDKFYRTDLNFLCYYDGSRWLTVDEYEVGTTATDNLTPISASNVTGRFSVRQDYQLFLTRWNSVSRVTGTSNGSNFWTIQLQYTDAANVGTTIASYVTSSDVTATWISHPQTINAALSSSAMQIQLVFTKTGSITSGRSVDSICYRLIVP